jgi:hypothetical protein
MLIATASVIADEPGESTRAFLFSGFFPLLWLVSAACFWSTAKIGLYAPALLHPGEETPVTAPPMTRP